MIFKVLPDARIKWKHVRAGAITTAILFMVGKFSMLAINTWLKEFGIPLIILGAISLCVKYFVSGKK